MRLHATIFIFLSLPIIADNFHGIYNLLPNVAAKCLARYSYFRDYRFKSRSEAL
jgi:hypothetical protein